MLPPLAILALFCLPSAAVAASIVQFRLAHDKAAKLPFTDKPLRLPGASSREKADELLESATDKMFIVLVGCPLIGAFCALNPILNPIAVSGPLAGFMVALCIVLGLRIRSGLKQSWNYRLGATGEQVVARELDRLIARGYQVFHDVPFEGWNIDHIVVGPHGIFAVETKTRRKPRLDPGQKHVVIYDGKALSWLGKWPDRKPIEQAERNSASLEKWLLKSTAERVAVNPVLALPGWMLSIKNFGNVAVYSATDMSDSLPKRSAGRLLPEQIERISYHIGQRCAS